MASAGNLLISIKSDATLAQKGFEQASNHANRFREHCESAGHGANRAFGFLGRQLKEAGEGLEGTNASLGGMVSGLGSVTSGVGEAMHGYHALNTVIRMATASQVALNLVSPMGLAIMAAAAGAAGLAYLTLSKHTETAEEKAKKLKETLGEVANLQGVALDHAAQEHIRELKELGDSFFGASAIEKVKEFSEAVEKLKEERSGKKADSEYDKLKEAFDALGKSDTQKFRENMEASGRSAKEISEAVKQFTLMANAVGFDKENKRLKQAKEEFEWAEKTKEAHEAYLAHQQALKTGDKSFDYLADEWKELDVKKQEAAFQKEISEISKKQREDEKKHFEDLAEKAKSLKEKSDPIARFKDEITEIQEMRSGLLNGNEARKAIAMVRSELMRSLEASAPISIPNGAVRAGSEGWNEVAKMLEENERQQWAQKQLEALQKQLSTADSSNKELKGIRDILGSSRKVTITI